eukprot:4316615-Pyramimonas_sp.AAC.1
MPGRPVPAEPCRRLQRRPWRAPRAIERGPAQVQAICADRRKLMFTYAQVGPVFSTGGRLKNSKK